MSEDEILDLLLQIGLIALAITSDKLMGLAFRISKKIKFFISTKMKLKNSTQAKITGAINSLIKQINSHKSVLIQKTDGVRYSEALTAFNSLLIADLEEDGKLDLISGLEDFILQKQNELVARNPASKRRLIRIKSVIENE